MVSSSRPSDQEHFGRYWDALVRGASPEELARLAEPLDPDIVNLTAQWRALRHDRRPQPAFAQNLERDLMEAFPLALPSAGPLRTPLPHPPNGQVPRRQSIPLPQRGHWALAQAAVVLLLIVAMIAAYVTYVRHEDRAAAPGVVTPSAPPTDVPMYRGNPARTGEMPGPGPSGQPVEVWRVHTEGPIMSAPALAGGSLVVGAGEGTIYALDAMTGNPIWSASAGAAISSSPAVANGLVYAGSDDGVLHALDATNGEERWRAPVLRSWSSVAVVDTTVFAADSFLHALNGETGSELWKSPLGDMASRSVAVADGLVYVGTEDGRVHALATDTGEERWQFQTDGGTLLTPAVAEGLVFQAIAHGELTQFYALDAATGDRRWTFTTPGKTGFHPPAIGGGMVYLPGQDHALYALDADTGAEHWRFITGDSIDASPALVGETLYVAGLDHILYAIDVDTGIEHWSYVLDGRVTAGPTVSGGIVYVGTTFGTIYAIGGSGTEQLAAPAIGAPSPSTSLAALAASPVAGTPAAKAPFELVWQTRGGTEPLSMATGLAFDQDGNVWVADANRNQFQIFTADGEFIEAWGEAGAGDGQFNFVRPGGEGITDIVFAPDGSFYIADSQNTRVQHFAADRTFIRAIGAFGTGDGQFIEPIGVDVDSEGNVFIIDDQRDVVQKFDQEGNFLLAFGEHGSAPGQFSEASWGDIGLDDTLWVTDAGNHRVQQFAPDGTFLKSVGESGALRNPQTVTIDAEGRVFVGDVDLGSVVVFDADGTMIASLESLGPGSPHFTGIGHVELDGKGHLYVDEINMDEGYEAILKFHLLPPLS